MKNKNLLKYVGLGVKKKEPDIVKFWHQGNYRPVNEEVTETALPIEGAIPPELSGLYVRNGTNHSHGPSEHFFDGDGMLHGIRLENGQAKWYRNRYVDTPVYRKENRKLRPRQVDTSSAVSLIYHGGQLLSLGEIGCPYVIDPDDLSTVGTYTYDGQLPNNMTAHPRIDPLTGELLFFGYNVVSPYLTYMRADASGKMLQVEPIEMSGASMIHDFAVTDNYVVFMDMPLRFSWSTLIKEGKGGMPFRWSEKHSCRFGVMPRAGTNADIKWFDIPPCFIFHIMNSFDQDDDVVIDAARYDRLWVENSHDFFHPARLSRFRMNMKTGQASVEEMFNKSMEFPQVSRKYWTKPYRYGYSVVVDEANTTPEKVNDAGGGIYKYDLQTGELDTWSSDYEIPGEPFFVPAHNCGGGEDEGYLLSFSYNKKTDISEFCIFDATHLSVGPVAKVKLPVRVPVGFHGVWVDDEISAARC